jgi:hypothetical protein
MRHYIVITLFLLAECHTPDTSTQSLQAQIDSLQIKIKNSYKPGLGEFMSSIQIHHAKLWFAGRAGNWQLSDFETKEIRESIEDIQNYCSDRPEVSSIVMINAPLDSIEQAIDNKDPTAFNRSFNLLTTTCNNCHRVTKHEFNNIQIPATPPFSNQSFQNQTK